LWVPTPLRAAWVVTGCLLLASAAKSLADATFTEPWRKAKPRQGACPVVSGSFSLFYPNIRAGLDVLAALVPDFRTAIGYVQSMHRDALVDDGLFRRTVGASFQKYSAQGMQSLLKPALESPVPGVQQCAQEAAWALQLAHDELRAAQLNRVW
jgi:hypothetical protein